MKRALLAGALFFVLAAGIWLLQSGPQTTNEPDNRAIETRVNGDESHSQTRTPRGIPQERPALETDDRSSTALDAEAEPDAAVRFVEKRPVMMAMNRRKAAYTAFRAGDHRTALALARETLEYLPRDGQAHRLAALSSCALGDRASAQNHAEMLDRRRFEKVQKRCAEHGISLRHPYEPARPDNPPR